MMAMLTHYEGFEFTTEELEMLAELWRACGIEMSPVPQAVIGTTSMFGVKFGGYVVWRKTQRTEEKVHEEELAT